MNELNNTNLLLKVKKIIREVSSEAKLLTTPSFKETIQRTITILIMCGFLCVFFIIIGEITVKLLQLFGI